MTTAADHIDALRRAAWKGGRRGVGDAVAELRDADPFQAAADALAELVDAYDTWDEDRTSDNRDDLEQALSAFDDACEPLFGVTEWQRAAEGGG